MDAHRFDALALILGSFVDRRTAVRALASGAIGAVAVLAGGANAKKRRKK